MKTRSKVWVAALALGLFAGGRVHARGAEGHGCPDYHEATCVATEGDEVKISIDWECMARGVATVTRAGHEPARYPIRRALTQRADGPDAYYGDRFLMLVWRDGRQLPASDLTGTVETSVDGQRVSREVRCEINRLGR